jgi:hypothetical protein
MLINNAPWTLSFRKGIQEVFDNLNLEHLSVSDFQEPNLVHRGLLIGIVNEFLHDIVSPFYPLDPTSPEYQSLVRISRAKESALMDILEQTQLA